VNDRITIHISLENDKQKMALKKAAEVFSIRTRDAKTYDSKGLSFDFVKKRPE